MFAYTIKEKGKCPQDDRLLNEIYLGNHRVGRLDYFIETENYIYYLSSEQPKILIRTNNNVPNEFTVIGFDPYDGDNPDITRHSKIIVTTGIPRIRMYGDLEQQEPVVEATFNHYTRTWDVRSNTGRSRKLTNINDALNKYRKTDEIGADNLSRTLKASQRIFSDIRIKSQKRKNKSPNA